MALFGQHLHNLVGSSDADLLTETEALSVLAAAGGKVARLDANWATTQGTAPTAAFSATAATLSDAEYQTYLSTRGFVAADGTTTLEAEFQRLNSALDAGVAVNYNFGVVPAWNSVAPNSASQISAAAAGEFLADFVTYISRQANGFDVLANTVGFQFFNEVNLIYSDAAFSTPTRALLPYEDYLESLGSAKQSLSAVLEAIQWETTRPEPAPNLLGPSLAGPTDAGFINAFIAAPSTSPTDAITFSTYGTTVQPWLDAKSPLDPSLAYGFETSDNPSYQRVLLPTDDLSTWKALVARDAADDSVDFGLKLYADSNNPAEAYFSQNLELGLERTKATLNQSGLGDIAINISEFGASSFVGDASAGTSSLLGTAFADPFKYGATLGEGAVLSQAIAENIQAESLVQSIGLIENWDFVNSATAYETFDDQGQAAGVEQFFGLANGLDAAGNPNLKPAGLAFEAYLGGAEFSSTGLVDTTENIGVDLHIAASGVDGAIVDANRQVDHHEVVLLRDGDDAFDAASGDDTVFGGEGSDIVSGDAGFDRLYGGAGDDALSGGDGADRIKGDAGNDTLTGGEGIDTFVFSNYAASGSGFAGSDVITDFTVAEDKILLVSGFSADELLNGTLSNELVVDGADGVNIQYADNGANVTLTGVTKADLTLEIFEVLDAIQALIATPPPVVDAAPPVLTPPVLTPPVLTPPVVEEVIDPVPPVVEEAPPVVEAPVVEAPVVEAPVVDAAPPVVEEVPPVVEVPVVDAAPPVVEEAPIVEEEAPPPVAELPVIDDCPEDEVVYVEPKRWRSEFDASHRRDDDDDRSGKGRRGRDEDDFDRRRRDNDDDRRDSKRDDDDYWSPNFDDRSDYDHASHDAY